MEESRERTDEGGGGRIRRRSGGGWNGWKERRGEGVAHSSERPPSNSAAVAAAARAGEQLHQPDRHAVREGGRGMCSPCFKVPLQNPSPKREDSGPRTRFFRDNCHS